MDNNLMPYARGEKLPGLRDRAIAKQGKKVYDEVRLKGMQADGAMALAGHVMEGVVELDRHRRSLAGNDELLNQMLVEVEINTIRQVSRIQASLFNQWDL